MRQDPGRHGVGFRIVVSVLGDFAEQMGADALRVVPVVGEAFDQIFQGEELLLEGSSSRHTIHPTMRLVQPGIMTIKDSSPGR